MNNLIYHRGQKNKTNQKRIMLNILFSRNNAYDYPVDEVIADSEVDEDQRYDKILQKKHLAYINLAGLPHTVLFLYK
jgi:hypothetical protein